MTIRIRTLLPLTLLCAAMSFSFGCRLVAGAAYLWGKDPTVTVKAEYPHMDGKTVLILVWADGQTLFEFPQVQYELAEHVRYQLEHDERLTGVKCCPSRQIAELQRRETDWARQHPAVLGERFGADRVLRIDLAEYGTREPGAEQLYRGRITADIAVYDPSYGDKVGPVWKPKEGPIHTVFPPDGPGRALISDDEIRRLTMEQFAVELARKFYDHEVKK